MAAKIIDQEIKELLDQVAAHSHRDRTVWMDADSITWVVMDSHQPGARRQVRKRLYELKRRGLVESRKFQGIVGWRLIKNGR